MRVALNCVASAKNSAPKQSKSVVSKNQVSRRNLTLYSLDFITVASLLTIGAVKRPSNIGIQKLRGEESLNVCPPSPNCISTYEDKNDSVHYLPPWKYGAKDDAEAMKQLAEVVATTTPDGFTPTIVKQQDKYLYAEYQSPIFGFIDDVEFQILPDGLVEYRSASRIGESDGDINRKRVQALRTALNKKGWKSAGF